MVGLRGLATVIVAVALGASAAAQGDGPAPRKRAAVQAVTAFVEGRSVEPEEFLRASVATVLVEAQGREPLLARLREIRAAIGKAEVESIQTENGVEFRLGLARQDEGQINAGFTLVDEPPHALTDLWVEGGPSLSGVMRAAAKAAPQVDIPMTWETLEARLQAEAKAGFAGAVLVVRDGKTVLNKGYGLANRERGIANTPETIFAIGSTPIDFTHAGILLLAQRGKLELGDPITEFFKDVPPDKRAITVEHLMKGRSGLPDFHDVPSDRDPDHAWIDRDEAVRRIFAQELLFAPGTSRRHSHSAWGLLAAIIEIVSGEPYPQFTREHLFKPAGMKDTGFFGDKIAADRLAIGYGMASDGEINAPPYWGPTSWLVMGSGGQVSTTGDLYRWLEALRGGKILEAQWAAKYFGRPGGVLTGGDQYGFEIVYTPGPGTLMIMVSNSNPRGQRAATNRLGRDLAGLVNAGLAPGFTLGLQLAIESEPGKGVTVAQVAAGSAAERDGIRNGDTLISANGTALGTEPMDVLDPLLRTGQVITFEIERDGAGQTIRVTPKPR